MISFRENLLLELFLILSLVCFETANARKSGSGGSTTSNANNNAASGEKGVFLIGNFEVTNSTCVENLDRALLKRRVAAFFKKAAKRLCQDYYLNIFF